MTAEASEHGLVRPWGRYSLGENGTVALRIGARDLWIRALDGEIRIAQEDRSPGNGDYSSLGKGDPAPEPSADTDWSRWAAPGEVGDVLLRPAMADRPLVVEPGWPFRLLPGAQARVFVRVPVWIRIELPVEGKPHVLAAIPSVTMSDTWWGDLGAGELAYWLPTTARRVMPPGLHAPHLAVCPLRLRNETGGELRIERLAVRVAYLTLFQSEGRLWADESRVLSYGGDETSQIEMAGRPPPEAGDAVLVTLPAVRLQKGFRARTLDRLRALHGGMLG